LIETAGKVPAAPPQALDIMAAARFSNAAANPAHLLFLQRKYKPTLSPPPRNRLQLPGFEQNFRDVTACFTCFIRGEIRDRQFPSK
jgi:hypothetical protein